MPPIHPPRPHDAHLHPRLEQHRQPLAHDALRHLRLQALIQPAHPVVVVHEGVVPGVEDGGGAALAGAALGGARGLGARLGEDERVKEGRR